MSANELPHNELVWWRMTRKQRYLPGRVVDLKLEDQTVGLEKEHEKILNKLLKPGMIVVNSFDDMKYAVCNTNNVKLYPAIPEEEQSLLERECIKSSKANYRALLRVKKLLEIRQLEQVKNINDDIHISPLEVSLIKYFKYRDCMKGISESIYFFETNTAIEILGTVISRKSLKTVIGQSPQAYSYLERYLKSENCNNNKISLENPDNEDFSDMTFEAREWQNTLNEIVVNRKAISELLSCIPIEILGCTNINTVPTSNINNPIEWESLVCKAFEEKGKRTQDSIFIIEYIKVSLLYIQVLARTVAMRVLNVSYNQKSGTEKKEPYVIVLSLSYLYSNFYDISGTIPTSFIKLRNAEVGPRDGEHWTKYLYKNHGDSKELPLNNSDENSLDMLSFCLKTTSPDTSSTKLFYRVGINKISSQLVLSSELKHAYQIYHNKYRRSDLDERLKALHTIRSSCPTMLKLLNEWLIHRKSGDVPFDHINSIENIHKIRDILGSVYK
ncbi:hypothetical protein cand_025400 [Cryptosporidium andersoni]|uniref:Uncharacterized protein n=1 Tax=Cryptosporidium andersoni TaxID=117008 RepID=A0A1J4MDM9_9CRYT|nr:hypothetical protein cand_025400 [Cryptosporidium andersoni]